MKLGSTDINTYKVCTALGVNTGDIGTLCTSKNINMWSKWKPIESTVPTMTLQELKNQRYGLDVLEANTPTELIRKIKQNGNKGVNYRGAKTAFRLGDFRNYYSEAPVTVETSKELYPNGKVNVGGVTSTNHTNYEIPITGPEMLGTEYSIGVEDLYHFTDRNGQDITVRRGAVVTDGERTTWYTGKLYWWDMLQFLGKKVDVYEFYTNTEKTPLKPFYSNANDRFFALPLPYFQLDVKDEIPAGSRIVTTILEAKFISDRQSPFYSVDWSVQFSAKGEINRGGTIYDVYVELCRDQNGIDVIQQKKLEDSLYIADETISFKYMGNFVNKPISYDQMPSEAVWIVVFFNRKRAASLMPEQDIGPEEIPYIIRNV